MSPFAKKQFQMLFAYHFHTQARLVERAALLSEVDYHANPGYGHGSIHALLFHLMRAEKAWRIALETGIQGAPERIENYPDLPGLQAAFAVEQQALLAWLERLPEDAIGADLSLTTQRGATFNIPCWRVLQHLILHGMQHHTEIAQLLTLKGQSPGDIDFIFYDG